MTDDRPTRLRAVLDSLSGEVEEADPHLRLRKEWKDADAWVRAHGDSDGMTDEALDDATREGDALRDLLALARSEVEIRIEAEERAKSVRLVEDEKLLAHLGAELKVYGGLILTTFVLPPAAFAPFGRWVGFSIVFMLFGLARMSKATSDVNGRSWLILQDRVDQVMQRIKVAHIMAVASVASTALWVVIAQLTAQANA